MCHEIFASYCVVKLRGVHHTAELASPVCIPPRSQDSPCASLLKVKLHDSRVCITLQCLTASRGVKIDSYCGVKWSKLLQKLGGVHRTVESTFTVCISPRSQTAYRGVKIEIFNFFGRFLLPGFGFRRSSKCESGPVSQLKMSKRYRYLFRGPLLCDARYGTQFPKWVPVPVFFFC